jgi:hypothetical protein
MIKNIQPYSMFDAPLALGGAQMLLRGAVTRLRCAIDSGDLLRIKDELSYSNCVESKYIECREIAPKNSTVTKVHRRCGDKAIEDLCILRPIATSVLRSSLRIAGGV